MTLDPHPHTLNSFHPYIPPPQPQTHHKDQLRMLTPVDNRRGGRPKWTHILLNYSRLLRYDGTKLARTRAFFSNLCGKSQKIGIDFWRWTLFWATGWSDGPKKWHVPSIQGHLEVPPHRLHRHFLGDIDGRYLPILVAGSFFFIMSILMSISVGSYRKM